MDNSNLDLYFGICFAIAGSITAFFIFIIVFLGLIMMSILLLPLFLVASVTDTVQMIGRGVDRIFNR